MKLTTFDPKKEENIIAGEYNKETKTFTRRVSAKHFMRMVQGYGMQEDIAQELYNIGDVKIVFISKDGKYTSKIEDWFRPNIRVMDFGNGNQRFLGIKDMVFTNK